MKKILVLLFTGLLLAGCSATSNDGGVETELVKGNGEITYSIDDLAFYGEVNESGERNLLMWLGMKEEDMNFGDDDFNRYYAGFTDTQYYMKEINSEQDMLEATEPPKEVVSFLNYAGGRMSISTSKDIQTTGFTPVEGKVDSTEEDIIKAYGLDPKNESIYSQQVTESAKNIILYFNMDSEGKVTRVVSPVGTEIDSIGTVNADFCLKFIVIEDRLAGIQMFRNYNKI